MSCLSLDHWNIRVWGQPVLLINLLQDGAGLIFFLKIETFKFIHICWTDGPSL